MMVEEERSIGTGSSTTRRSIDEILKESRGVLKNFTDLLDEMDEVIQNTKEDAIRERDGSHRWGL